MSGSRGGSCWFSAASALYWGVGKIEPFVLLDRTMSSHVEFPPDTVMADTVRWLEYAVIGLNLCPFAKGVHTKGQVHYVVSEAIDTSGLLEELRRELTALAEISADERDTTLLIAPQQRLDDFLDFNDFLERVDKLVDVMNLGGILQVASFHPRFQFADADVDDITNATNRAPYPTLHLLRESSIDHAVQAFPDAAMIYERNMQVLQDLGTRGWEKLDVGPQCSLRHA